MYFKNKKYKNVFIFIFTNFSFLILRDKQTLCKWVNHVIIIHKKKKKEKEDNFFFLFFHYVKYITHN